MIQSPKVGCSVGEALHVAIYSDCSYNISSHISIVDIHNIFLLFFSALVLFF